MTDITVHSLRSVAATLKVFISIKDSHSKENKLAWSIRHLHEVGCNMTWKLMVLRLVLHMHKEDKGARFQYLL